MGGAERPVLRLSGPLAAQKPLPAWTAPGRPGEAGTRPRLLQVQRAAARHRRRETERVRDKTQLMAHDDNPMLWALRLALNVDDDTALNATFLALLQTDHRTTCLGRALVDLIGECASEQDVENWRADLLEILDGAKD